MSCITQVEYDQYEVFTEHSHNPIVLSQFVTARERASYLGRGGGGGGTRGAGRGGRGRLDFCLLAVLMLDSLGLGGSLGVPLVLGGREGGQGGPGGPVVGLCRPEQ